MSCHVQKILLYTQLTPLLFPFSVFLHTLLFQIDPLLTPTGKKLKDGTRAVARQVTSDILPQLAQSARQGNPSPLSQLSSLLLQPPPFMGTTSSEDLSQATSRVFNILQQQFQRNLETLQQDLADPFRNIPQRLVSQTTEFVKEAQNVFAETPTGLQEPKYTLVCKTQDYEIRDYDTYQVASTQMSDASVDDWTQTGAAFNTLANYLFGANAEQKVMDMTTPVTTTMTGEMRFYLADPQVPAPLGGGGGGGGDDDDAKTKSLGSSSGTAAAAATIEIQTLPPARLAVRRFTGFCTDGEIARQKQALLTALQLDGVELDVPHGQTVPHVVFQYNPPYALPVIRRNEIAVPVVGASEDLEVTTPWVNEDPWETSTNNNDE